MDGGDGTAPAEDLFPIFVVAILSVFTIPWTINKVFCSESKEEVVHGKMKKEDVKRKVIEKVSERKRNETKKNFLEFFTFSVFFFVFFFC